MRGGHDSPHRDAGQNPNHLLNKTYLLNNSGQLLPMMVSTRTAFGAVYASETASLPTPDRKFKPQSACQHYALNPLSSSTFLCSPQPSIYFSSKTAFVWCSQRFDARNKWQMHTAYNPELAAHTTHCTTPAHFSHQSALRRMCHLYSAGLPAQCLVKLQFRDRLCIDTHIVQQPIMPGFRSQVWRLLCSVNIHFIQTSSGRGI